MTKHCHCQNKIAFSFSPVNDFQMKQFQVKFTWIMVEQMLALEKATSQQISNVNILYVKGRFKIGLAPLSINTQTHPHHAM